MERDFKFESDHFLTPDGIYCAEMQVSFEVMWEQDEYSIGGGGYSTHITEIFDVDNKVVRKLEDFPEKEQNKILKLADEYGCDHAYEAYEETVLAPPPSQAHHYD